MLKIHALYSGYGPIEIIHGINLQVPKGKMVGLLGANGSGKTTLFKTISGLVKLILEHFFQDKDIVSYAPQ
jgi:branched-chain amino acid transport system ATP-binding protein